LDKKTSHRNAARQNMTSDEAFVEWWNENGISGADRIRRYARAAWQAAQKAEHEAMRAKGEVQAKREERAIIKQIAWIPIEQAKPKDTGDCLAWFAYGGFGKARWYSGRDVWGDLDGCVFSNVTHWAIVPAPTKEK
jgi:hypothetical protein